MSNCFLTSSVTTYECLTCVFGWTFVCSLHTQIIYQCWFGSLLRNVSAELVYYHQKHHESFGFIYR